MCIALACVSKYIYNISNNNNNNKNKYFYKHFCIYHYAKKHFILNILQ